MRLPLDFDFDWALSFLGARAIPGLEEVRTGSYGRVVAVGGRLHWLGCSFSRREVLIRVEPPLPPRTRRGLVSRLFDLDFDLRPFRRHVRRDPILGSLVRRRPGLRRPVLLDPFEATVRAIVGQLVSVAAATTLTGRLVDRFGPPLSLADGRQVRGFPGPADVARAGRRSLAGLGLPGGKVTAILAVTEGCLNGEIDWKELTRDPLAADARLRAIPGIGPWTSAYVRWRALGDADAFPDTDLGIVRALAARGIARRDVLRCAERWRPWRGLAIGHLWTSLAD